MDGEERLKITSTKIHALLEMLMTARLAAAGSMLVEKCMEHLVELLRALQHGKVSRTLDDDKGAVGYAIVERS